MASVVQKNFRVRRSYANIKQVIDIPNLIDIQKQSYEKFLQMDVAPDEREDVGLQGVFKSVFPIKDFNETCSLEFVSYHLEKPKYDVEECHQRGMTYAAPLKVLIRLVVWDRSEEDGTQSIRDVKEQEVFFGEIPLQTDDGTFVINGTERVVVSQLHRSPGAFFDHDKGKTHSSGKLLYSARVIPYRGSWLDFEFDAKDILYVRIDRRRKMPATVLLRALGFSTEELLHEFYATETIFIGGEVSEVLYKKPSDTKLLLAQKATLDITTPDGSEILLKKGRKFTQGTLRKMQQLGIAHIPVLLDDVLGSVVANDVVDLGTGEVLVECNDEITESKIRNLRERGIESFEILFIDNLTSGPFLRKTLALDKIETPDEAVVEIYKRLRPGDPPMLETAYNLFNNLFFNPERYDLSHVGRLKLNHKFKLKEQLDNTVLTKRDIIECVRYLIALRDGKNELNRNNPDGTNDELSVKIDDIDHLGNRRVRAVGELMENQYRIGLVRMERAIKERMSMSQEIETLMPHDLINAKPVSAVVKEYFGSSQLSQFMDQTNPLSEVTHKRRLSALGPGGLTRERAGFEVRDVHMTHYGRICPIETPEGPNIGLITSLACYARVNDLGFIETPYRVVKNGKVTNELAWLDANREEDSTIAQANAKLNDDHTFVDELVLCRHGSDFPLTPPPRIDYMDVAPEQLVSIAAALIPFLEHDDANRALMGSNMQRQAVPLLNPQTPLVGTGLERTVAEHSGATVIAMRGGVVIRVTADEIIVDAGPVEKGKPGADEPLARLTQQDRYKVRKYWRTNQDTAINQRPIVRLGQTVKAGEVLADGAATEQGQLALGSNVLVAFMPWYGHNFEDAIVLSERLVKEDVYSSIHIQEMELHVRDTKRGKEEITREIPNVSEESLVDLDERGIVRIGAHVRPGDILVGKITPKGETELSPEEKLLTAIFGEKAKDVKDSSLKVSPGVEGVVIDVKIFSRVEDQVVEKDRGERIGDVRRLEGEEKVRVNDVRDGELKELLAGQIVALALKSGTVEEAIPVGTKLTDDVLEGIRLASLDLKTFRVESKKVNESIREIIDAANEVKARIEEKAEERIDRILQPDELPPGVLQLVKVYLAEKRKISVGDKMAGRHGNKGIVARIVPEEDMPFLPDGRPVDIVLNPLGVPSRMNVGQILETHLGWAARILGFYAKTPVFQGANEREIGMLLRLAGLNWIRGALRINAAPPTVTDKEIKTLLADMRPEQSHVDTVQLLADATLNDLGSRSMSQGSRDVYHSIRDFIAAAAKELADREIEAIGNAIKFNAGSTESEDFNVARKADFKKAAKDLEKRATMSGSAILEEMGFTHLASMLVKKSDADVDAAAVELLRLAGLQAGGKIRLRDGRTGERFASAVTVGEIYMLKLSHLVDDKIHARSIGPYSLVTQQPLAGKAQFGGQRFGEMEVWALEAYGAAHTLQEILTVKSDDVSGRSRVYEAIVKGQNLPDPGTPESFNVLVKELQALGIHVTMDANADGYNTPFSSGSEE